MQIGDNTMMQHSPIPSGSHDIVLDDAIPWWHMDSATNQHHVNNLILLVLLTYSEFKTAQGLLQLLVLDDR